MNQILFFRKNIKNIKNINIKDDKNFIDNKFNENNLNYNLDNFKKNNNSNNIKKRNNKYKYLTIKTIFFILVFVIITFLLILFFKMYNSFQNEELSKKLNSSYSISTLYSNNIGVETSDFSKTSSNPFVIGIIRIDKINVNYSILSMSSDDLLEVSVCRFAGPMPNEVGNLCIAGHNYVNNNFFGRLNELELGDIITIYDLNGNSIDYKIYDIYQSSSDDTSCTFQNTDNKKIVTLVTCNNVNGKRLIIHSEEIP